MQTTLQVAKRLHYNFCLFGDLPERFNEVRPIVGYHGGYLTLDAVFCKHRRQHLCQLIISCVTDDTSEREHGSFPLESARV